MISPPWAIEWFGYSLWAWAVMSAFVIWASLRSGKVGIPLPFAAYLLLMAVCAIFAHRPDIALLGINGQYDNGVAQFALVAAASGLVIRREWLKNVVLGLIVISSLQAILQFANPKIEFLTPYAIWQGRAYAPFGSPIFLGSFLAVAGVWVLPSSRWPYWLLWGLALAATKTRGAMLAAAVGFLVANRKRLNRNAWAAIIGIAIILGGWKLSSDLNRSDSGRLAVWRVCLNSIAQRPITGWGPENAYYAIQKNRDKNFDDIYTTTTQGHCHNNVLEAAMMGGWAVAGASIGLAIILLLSMTGDTGRGAWAAYMAVGLFNPVPLSTQVLGALIFAANLRKSSGIKIHTMWLATASLSVALYCALNAVTVRDKTLPASVRLIAAKAVGIVDR